MLLLHNLFGLENVEVCLARKSMGSQKKSALMFELNKADKNSPDDLITISVLRGFFVTFLLQNKDTVISDAELEISKFGFGKNDKSIKTTKIILQILENNFYKYVYKNEIEIACAIAREKSSYYVNKYTA